MKLGFLDHPTVLLDLFKCDFICSLDNLPTSQLTVSQVVDWSTRGLVNLHTGQVTDWSAR